MERLCRLGTCGRRTQLPLCLSWASTIHCSQSLTLPKVTVDLGRKEMSAGLSYVALSRVRKFDDLRLQPFEFARLSCIKNKVQRRVDAETDLKKL